MAAKVAKIHRKPCAGSPDFTTQSRSHGAKPVTRRRRGAKVDEKWLIGNLSQGGGDSFKYEQSLIYVSNVSSEASRL